MSKQDGYASRTPADLERKYKFGETFAEVFGLVSDARKLAEEAQSAIDGLDQEQIFNLLTNNGKAQGIYRDDNGDVYVNASYIKSGKLAAEYIDATNLKVDAANITGTFVVGEQLPDNLALKSEIPTALSQLVNDSGFVVESGVTTIVKGVVTTDYVNALGLKVKAANITGTLTIGQLPSTVAETSDIPTKTSQLTNNSGFVDSDAVTTITNNAISTATISADQIYGGTISGVTFVSSGTWAYEDITISDGVINVGGGGARIGSNGTGSGYFAADTDVLIEGNSNAYLQCGWNYLVATQSGAKMSYNYDDYKIWVDGNGCWSNKAMAVYSDKRLKSDINYNMAAYEEVFKGLRPCTFFYNGEKGGKRHMGFVAQEFAQAVADNGLTENDFAMIASDGTHYGIAYGEMTALNTHMIQRLMERVSKLEENT